MIMSEASLHQCVSDIATLRNKGELHFALIQSVKIQIIVVQKKYTYAVTHLGKTGILL